jgi:hypothetical protein
MLACKDRQAKGDIMNSKKDLTGMFSSGFLHEQNFDTKNPDVYVVTLSEYEQLQGEHVAEVEGMSYEEYCETEKECWNEMLKEQLKEPWEKILPEYLLNPVPMVIARKKLTIKPVLRRMLLNSIFHCDLMS